jgi:surfeit locus 1 family protein
MSPAMTRRSRFSFLAFCLFAALVCTRLGVWQLSRLKERRALNQRVLAARNLPQMDLNDPSAVAQVPRDGWSDRRVSAGGSYDFGTEFVLRRQAMNGTPGVRVVTPLRPQSGDSAVLVIRGFVPSPDAATVALDSLREPEIQRVEGIAVPVRAAPAGGEPLERGHKLTWGRLDLADVRARLSYPVRDFAILQTPDSSLPHYPVRLEPASLDDGPHLSYAVQWFGFAVTALGAGVALARRKD